MKHLVIVRGGGELASGVIHCLYRAGLRSWSRNNLLLPVAGFPLPMPSIAARPLWSA